MNIKLRLTDVAAATAGRVANQAADAAARHMGGSLVPTKKPANASNECEKHGCTFICQVVEGGTTYLVYYCADGGEYVVYEAD